MVKKTNKEKDKYNFFTVENVINFLENNVKSPFTWNGEGCIFNFNSRRNITDVKDGFYNQNEGEINDLEVWLTTKLGEKPVPAVLNVNDFTFKITIYDVNRKFYRPERTINLSSDWCIERLLEHGEKYRKNLIKHNNDIIEQKTTEIETKLLELENKKISILEDFEKFVNNRAKKLNNILDKAVEKQHKPGSAAQQVINNLKKEDIITEVYGHNEFDRQLPEKPVNKPQPKEDNTYWDQVRSGEIVVDESNKGGR